MEKRRMSKRELKERADFFCKMFFGFKFMGEIRLVDFNPDEPCAGKFDIPYENNIGICEIEIINFSIEDIELFDDILIHELIHYALWYMGWPYKDHNIEFCNKCKELGIGDNFHNDADYERIREYEKKYQEYADSISSKK